MVARKIKKVLVVHMSYHTKNHRDTMNLIKRTLTEHGIEHYFLHRSKLNNMVTLNKDLIIAVGGDGTFIRTSHFVFDKTPIFGVNSDPNHKEGFFLKSRKETFVKNFERILAGKTKLTKFSRVQASINGKKVQEYAINEFYFGHRKGHGMSEYKILHGKKSERHKSSGVIVSAGAGSRAWLASAGGKLMPLHSAKAQFIVREVYDGTLTGNTIKTGYFGPRQSLKLVSESKYMLLVADSVGKEYPVKRDSVVEIKTADKMINAYWF